jgi:hypothetical protein
MATTPLPSATSPEDDGAPAAQVDSTRTEAKRAEATRPDSARADTAAVSAGAADRLLWLIVAGALLALWGYFGPWAPHKAAGLVILGLDLAELVKFLPAVQAGSVSLWREGFYAPLVATSVALSLVAFRLPLRPPILAWLVRGAVVLLAMVAALNLLPPAWSPPLLRTPEFRVQSAVMLLCILLALVSPLLALLPRRLVAGAIVLLSGAAVVIPVAQYLRVRPLIEEVYSQPLPLGWGLCVTAAGLLLVAAGATAWGFARRN